MSLRVHCAAGLCWLRSAFALLPRDACAQPTGVSILGLGRRSLDGRVEISGPRDADETTVRRRIVRLFASDTELGGTTAADATLGVRLTRLLRAEIIVSYATRLNLRTHLEFRCRGIPDTEASESIGQLTLEGSGLIDLTAWRLPPADDALSAAGGGYLRHLARRAGVRRERDDLPRRRRRAHAPGFSGGRRGPVRHFGSTSRR